jgi:hypothetical protein
MEEKSSTEGSLYFLAFVRIIKNCHRHLVENGGFGATIAGPIASSNDRKT